MIIIYTLHQLCIYEHASSLVHFAPDRKCLDIDDGWLIYFVGRSSCSALIVNR